MVVVVVVVGGFAETDAETGLTVKKTPSLPSLVDDRTPCLWRRTACERYQTRGPQLMLCSETNMTAKDGGGEGVCFGIGSVERPGWVFTSERTRAYMQ